MEISPNPCHEVIRILDNYQMGYSELGLPLERGSGNPLTNPTPHERGAID